LANSRSVELVGDELSERIRLRDRPQFFQGFPSEPLGDLSQRRFFDPNLQPRESEIVDAVFQSEKPIRGEPVESFKLRYFNSFEFFDHTG
jgi:hypothetical protein